jgi:uncharacterized protein YbjT (DUF2867 family)
MITVFGATGNTGGAAAAHLLGQGKKVRVVGRSSDKLAGLVKAGAEAAIGDIEDSAFVRKAMTGAEAAYVLIPPNMTTDDFRGYQKRVVDNLASGIEAAGVRYVVLLSSIGAHHGAGTGPIVAVHEFEERLKKLGKLNALFLRPSFFMQNVLMGIHSIKSQGIFTGPMPADAAVTMIAPSDIGSYAGGRLARPDFSGKSVVHLMGPKAVSQADVVRILGQAIGKPVRYVQVSLDEVEKGMLGGGLSPSAVSVFMEMYRAAGQGLVAPEQGLPIETCPTTFETFAKEVFAPAFRAVGG